MKTVIFLNWPENVQKKYEKNIPENLMRRMDRYMKMASKDVIL